MSKINWLTIIKAAIMIGAYGYLVWVLITFDKYEQLYSYMSNINLHQIKIFLLVILLMPINWLLEALKWEEATYKVEQKNLWQSYKSVIAGLASGFFTPNRIGDFVGRVLYFEPKNRTKCALLTITCSLGQLFATMVCGLLAISQINIYSTWSYLFILITALIIILFFSIPFVSDILSRKIKFDAVSKPISALASVDIKQLINITLLSFARFATYCTQFYLLLIFFGTEIDFATAIKLIPINYLLITVTPSVSFSELGIRGSYAGLVIGNATTNNMSAILAGVTIWAINYIIPMIIGTIFVLRNNRTR